MPPLDIHNADHRVDIDFSVPFRHRLRFSDDCFGKDWPEVAKLFEAEEGPARLQVWIDQGVSDSDSSIVERIQACIQSSSALTLTRPPQLLVGGEQIKTSDSAIEYLLQAIHDDGLDRRNYVLVIGGGAILDAVGYAAAIAHRGIRLVRFPTTTLAQADSGVGVKNAVNAFGKKNWKGTFSVPWAVVNDQSLLTGLSDRDFRSGFSEAVKVSLLKSPSAFHQLCQNAKQIAARDMSLAIQAIRASVLTHLHHITYGGDPFECNEARPLDFGHWSAHKLESLCKYQLRHGEAVAIGIAIDVVYSSLKHQLPREIVERTLQALHDLELPIFHPKLDDAAIFEGLEEFRQHLGGRLTLTMIQDLGKTLQVHTVDLDKMKQAIDYLASESDVRKHSAAEPVA
jgi:3-dehydroquinate synthase